MASGKTIEMYTQSAAFRWYPQEPWEQKPRDRSLRGKARRRARKDGGAPMAENKTA